MSGPFAHYIRTGTRFEFYDQLVAEAIEETKVGGDVAKAQVFATLARAAAAIATEDSGDRQITGSLSVDS